MRIQWIFLILMILFCSLKAFSQQEVLKVLNKPTKYIKPVEGVLGPQTDDKQSDKPWYVYSDRSHNPVYSNASGQNITSEIVVFGEKLAVMGISSDGARLLVAKERDIEGRQLRSGSNALGWVNSEKVLLWEKSLVDDQYGIDKKAMILFTLDAARQTIGRGDEFTTDVPIFQKPTDDDFDDTLGFHQGLFQFFPIYKREGSFLLLGESLTLNINLDYNGLKGWVNSDNVSEWSHRVAWEKNWNPKAVAEREKNVDSIGIMVLQNVNEAQTYANTNRKREFNRFVNMESPYLEMAFTAKRKPGPMGRYPILDIKDISSSNDSTVGRPIKVGVIGEVMDLDGKVIDIKILYKMTKEINTLRNVNIIFVIDATESVVPYRKSVIQGVKDAMKSIRELYKENKSDDDKNKFWFGCLLYRDYHMEATVQRFGSDFSQDTSKFFNWLDKNMVLKMNKGKEGVTGVDDLAEAMFYGMKYALDDYGPDERKSNYMILIGDCGDHQDTTSPRNELYVGLDDMAKELTSYNMNLLAFQVHNKNNDAYELFNTQTKWLLEKIGDTSLIINDKNLNLFELPEEAKYNGKLLSCEKGKSIAVKDMAGLISENIKQINKDVNGKIKNIARALKGQSNLDPWSTAKVIKFFSENGFTPEKAEKIIKSGMNQEYEVGYTVMQCKEYDYPNYETVVLYERSELKEVVDSFKDLAAAANYPADDKRTRLKDAMQDWFPKYFSGIQDSVLKDLPVGKLLEKITGLHFGERYQNITIAKIIDERLISDTQVNTFVTDLDSALEDLEDIYNRSRTYPARVEIPGDTKTLYVYIPGFVFPHE